MALEKSGYMAPGQDQLVCYKMFRQLPDKVLKVDLIRYGVKVPRYYLLLSLGEKKTDNAGNCRPIALTSHLCKCAEKVFCRGSSVVCRLSYYLEQREMISAHQNEFHKGSTIDALR